MAGINYMAEAAADYVKAMKLGKKEGDTVPVLDDILKEKNIFKHHKNIILLILVFVMLN